MININEFDQALLFILNKNEQGKAKPADRNRATNMAQRQLFKERYGKPEEYQPGRPVPRQAFAMTQKIHDDLAGFIEGWHPELTDGTAPLPDDYAHLITLWSESEDDVVSMVKVIGENELPQRLSSHILKPTKMHPVATMDKVIRVYPKTIPNVSMSYLRLPAEAKWAYTTESGRPVYDPENSVDLEWPEGCMNDLLIRAASFLGVNLKAGDITQYAEAKQQSGI
jgi:hypothetical protein